MNEPTGAASETAADKVSSASCVEDEDDDVAPWQEKVKVKPAITCAFDDILCHFSQVPHLLKTYLPEEVMCSDDLEDVTELFTSRSRTANQNGWHFPAEFALQTARGDIAATASTREFSRLLVMPDWLVIAATSPLNDDLNDDGAAAAAEWFVMAQHESWSTGDPHEV